jgi:hypothetical protein
MSDLPSNFCGIIPLNHEPTVRIMLNAGVNLQMFKFDCHAAWGNYDLVREIFDLGYKFNRIYFLESLSKMFRIANAEMCCKYLDLFIEYNIFDPSDKEQTSDIVSCYLKYMTGSFVSNKVMEYMVINFKVDYNVKFFSLLLVDYNLFINTIELIKQLSYVSDTEIFCGMNYALRTRKIGIQTFIDIASEIISQVDSEIFFKNENLFVRTFNNIDLFKLYCKVGIDFVSNHKKCFDLMLSESIRPDAEIMTALANMGFDFAADDNRFIRKICSDSRYFSTTVYWLNENGYDEILDKYCP